MARSTSTSYLLLRQNRHAECIDSMLRQNIVVSTTADCSIAAMQAVYDPHITGSETRHPSVRHTMLCMRKFMPVPGVCQEPFKPEKPSVTAYMLFSSGLLKLKRSRYAATGCRHRSMKVCSATDLGMRGHQQQEAECY